MADSQRDLSIRLEDDRYIIDPGEGPQRFSRQLLERADPALLHVEIVITAGNVKLTYQVEGWDEHSATGTLLEAEYG